MTFTSVVLCLLAVSAVSHAHRWTWHRQTFEADIARTKRQATEQSAVCLLACIETMEEQLDEVKSVRTQKTETTMCQRYEPEQLEALCRSHNQAKDCVQQCPDGHVKTVGMSALTPLNFMCVERLEDFKKHLPCLDATCESVEKTCEPVCRQYKGSVDKLTALQRDKTSRLSYEMPAVAQMVSDACQFIDCFNNCSRPMIAQQCGDEGADLQRDTVRKAFSSITNLLMSVGADDQAFPDACRALAGDETPRPSPPTDTNQRPAKDQEVTTVPATTGHSAGQSFDSAAASSEVSARPIWSLVAATLLATVLLL